MTVLMRRPLILSAALTVVALSASLAACGSSASQRITAVSASSPARWKPAIAIRRVLDLSAPRDDGAIVVAADKRLALLRPSGAVQPLGSPPGGYLNPGGEEPYIALSSGPPVPGAGAASLRRRCTSCACREAPASPP